MNFPDIRKLAVGWFAAGGLAVVAATMGGMPNAHAHWGHLGEVAGHGHLVGAALGVAAWLAAVLLTKGRNQSTDDEDNAETDSEINTGDEGEMADA